MERSKIAGFLILVMLLIGFGVFLYLYGFSPDPINETTSTTTPTTTTSTTPTTTAGTTTTTVTTTTTTIPPTLLDIIIARGTIIAGTSSGWPPFEMVNTTDDSLYGFDIDVTEMIADYLNVTVSWVDMDFDGLIGACQVGTIDMTIAGMYLTTERTEVLAASIPYIQTNQCVVVKSGSLLEIGNLTELGGLDVGVLTSTVEDEELTNLNGGITIIRYPLAETVFADLDAGTIDAVYIDVQYIQVYSAVYNVTTIFTVEVPPCVIYCKQTATDFLTAINTVLSDATTDGRLDDLIAKWFS
ncbi:MAG: ABC transporter substrate-binding protein [Candidatus Thorarchaeota archaeon]